MAICNNCGKSLIKSGGKCIYCGALVEENQQGDNGQQGLRKSKPIKQMRSFVNSSKSVKDLIIKVTSPCFDDIGKILKNLNVSYFPFDGKFNCDILFLNCGTNDYIDSVALKKYVYNGGILYASDLTSRHLLEAWPKLMTINNNTTPCTIKAIVLDPDLRQYLGKEIDIKFDMGVWSMIEDARDGKVLMRSANEGFPIMVEFSIGQGKIFYTSFHNHAQTEKAEEKLLKLLVIKQVSVATKMKFQQTIQSMSASI